MYDFLVLLQLHMQLIDLYGENHYNLDFDKAEAEKHVNLKVFRTKSIQSILLFTKNIMRPEAIT